MLLATKSSDSTEGDGILFANGNVNWSESKGSTNSEATTTTRSSFLITDSSMTKYGKDVGVTWDKFERSYALDSPGGNTGTSTDRTQHTGSYHSIGFTRFVGQPTYSWDTTTSDTPVDETYVTHYSFQQGSAWNGGEQENTYWAEMDGAIEGLGQGLENIGTFVYQVGMALGGAAANAWAEVKSLAWDMSHWAFWAEILPAIGQTLRMAAPLTAWRAQGPVRWRR